MSVIYRRVPEEKLQPHSQLFNPKMKEKQSNLLCSDLMLIALEVFCFFFIFIYKSVLDEVSVTESSPNLSCRSGCIHSSNSGV